MPVLARRSARLAMPGAVALVSAALLCTATTAGAQTSRDPVLVQSGITDVVIFSPSRLDPSGDRARLQTLLRGCPDLIRSTDQDSAAFVDAAVPMVLDVPAGARPVMLSVLPHQVSLVDCGDARTAATVAAARGLRIAQDSSYAIDRDLLRVALRRGDQVITPLETRSHPIRRLGATGLREERAQWISVAVDLADLAPGPSGRVTDIVVEVQAANGHVTDRFPLPWSALRATWENALALDIPRAIEARAQAGLGLVAAGDIGAARIVLGGLLEAEPCFSLAPTADPHAREIVGALDRRVTRCAAQSPERTALRAALLPGFGRPRDDRSVWPRALLLASVTALTYFAVREGNVANERYANYVAYDEDPWPDFDPVDVVARLYGQAESKRTEANRLGMAAAAAWGAQLVFALRQESRFARHLRGVRDLGGTHAPPLGNSPLGISPLFGPTQAGFVLSIDW